MASASSEQWWDDERTTRRTNTQAPRQDIKTFFERHKQWFDGGLEIQQYELHRRRPTANFGAFGICYDDIHANFNEQVYLSQPHIYKKSRLKILSNEEAVCNTVETGDQQVTIHINGRVNCGQAYSDDIVYIKLEKEGEPEADGKHYGKVISLVERTRFRNIEHPVLICIKDRNQGHLMLPICKTIPKINVLHGRIAEDRLRTSVEVHRYAPETRSLAFDRYLTIKEDNRQNYLFVVVLIKWKRTNTYPLGAVLGDIRCTSNVEETTTLLSLQHRIPLWSQDAATVNDFQRLLNDHLAIDNAQFIFTIGEPNERYINHGFSVETRNSNTIICVHVADISQLVQKDSELDEIAKERGFSISINNPDTTNAMFPEQILTMSSLTAGLQRTTFSVAIEVNENGDIVDKSLRKSFTQSNRHYTFLEAERIIANETDEMNEFESDLRRLHAVSDKLRFQRLGHSYLSVNAKIDLLTDCSYMSTTKARHMVQELLCQANQTVGQLLHHRFPNHVPFFRRQRSNVDNVEEVDIWYENIKNTASLAIQSQNQRLIHYPRFTIDNVLTHSLSPEGNQQQLVISAPERILNYIFNLLDAEFFSEAIFLLSCDSLFPKQAIVLDEMDGLNPLSQYSVIPTTTKMVHFTQPFDRYCDLIIQRLVNAYIENTAAPYEPRVLHRLCTVMNKSLKKKQLVEDELKTTAVALHLINTPISFLCYIKDISQEEFCILVPGLQHIKQRFIIRYKDIGVCNISREIPENETGCAVNRESIEANTQEDAILKLLVEWRMRIYSYTETVEQPALEGTESALIYPHSKAAFVRCSFWKDVIRHVISHDNQALRQTFLGMTNHLEDVECSENSVRDISSETDDDIIVNHAVQFGMCLHRGQIISVQLSSEKESGKCTPTPQILNLTDNVKLCLVHVKDPIKIFSKYALKSTIHDTERSYRRVRDYLDIWIPIIEMESTINAVKDRIPIIINDIPVKFRDREGYFELNEEFCEKRDLNFGYIPETDVTETMYYHNLPSGSYLCIMFPQELDEDSKIKIGNKLMHEESVIWSGHAVTTKISKYLNRDGPVEVITLRVVFRMHEGSPQPPVDRFERCRIEVLHKTIDDRRLETNMKALPNSSDLAKNIALGSRLAVPDRLHMEIAERVIDEGLNAGLWENNDKQHYAIRTSLQRKFKLIQGPPGTGKTYIGVKLIYLFNKFNTLMANESGEERKKIVFCGPSNKSVDLVARLVLQQLQGNAPTFVRIYGGSFEHMDFPMNGTAFDERWSLHGSQTDPILQENGMVLHHIIRQEGKPYAEQLRGFDQNAERATLEDVKEYKKTLFKAAVEELPNYDVIFCTASMVANPKVVRALKDNVYQLIIDESGMCSEPSSIVPIIASAAEQVVLIGDHKQLRPIVKCTEAAKLGLETSLFERYSNDHMYRTMLDVQYRMHPDICEFPSSKFYGGELRTNPGTGGGYDPLSIWPRRNGRHIPHVFCHVEGTEEKLVVKTEAGNEQSRLNEVEIEHVVRLYNHLINEERVPPESINVMSQYNAQCTRLREELPQANVSTVVQSQGGEWNYVIFSLVRSLPDYLIPETPTAGWKNQALGFITDQNQINVALTRAKRGLIIIGNTKLLRCDPVWKDLIQHYRNKDCVFNAETFPEVINH